MKESVAIAKEADAKKEFSSNYSSKIIHRFRDEPERQLGSLRDVIDNITLDGGAPSVESIATKLSSMPSTAERAPALLALQRTHGNRYVQRVVAGIQAKLKVGQPNDKYEQEVDRVAEEVTRMHEPEVKRQAEEEEKLPTQPKTITPIRTLTLQRQEDEEEEEEETVQAKRLPGHEILDDAIQNMCEKFVENKVPPVKYAKIAGRLIIKFAEGIGDGLLKAHHELKPQYDKITKAPAPTTEAEVEQIKFVCRWQANAAGELGEIVEGALLNVFKELVDIVKEETVGKITEEVIGPPLEKVGDAIGDFVGDFLTGDIVPFIDFINQETENQVQDFVNKAIVRQIGLAFAESVADYAIEGGMTELEAKKRVEEFEKKSEEKGTIIKVIPEIIAEKAAMGMKLEMVSKDVNEKIKKGLDKMGLKSLEQLKPKEKRDEARKAFSKFTLAYIQLVKRKLDFEVKFGGMRLIKRPFSKEDEKLINDMLELALEGHTGLFLLNAAFLEVGVSFKADMEVLSRFRLLLKSL